MVRDTRRLCVVMSIHFGILSNLQIVKPVVQPRLYWGYEYPRNKLHAADHAREAKFYWFWCLRHSQCLLCLKDTCRDEVAIEQ